MIQIYMNGRTVSVAESASVGNLAKLLAAESGASKFFQGGVVAYSLRQKVKLLGVGEDHAQAVNCVSHQVAAEMARGVRNLFMTDVGVSITGYADPDKHGKQFCYVGLSAFDQEETFLVVAPPLSRVRAQEFFASAAYNRLLTWLKA